MPKVSVNICCFNSEKYLEETLRSVIQQSYRDWELVVVDDGSTDGTDKILRHYMDQGFPIVFYQQGNRGFASARNKCVDLSSGEWIALIDHDDLCLPDRLEKQVALSEKYPNVSFFFANTEFFRDDGVVLSRVFDAINPCEWDLSAGNALNLLLTHGNFITSASVFVRKDLVTEVGGFTEGYRYIADFDFFLRVAERHALCAQDRIVSNWRRHPNQATQTMKGIIDLEHIQLFQHWLHHPSINTHTRQVVRRHILKYLYKHAKFLGSNGQHAAALTYLSKSIWYKPIQRLAYRELIKEFGRLLTHSGEPAAEKR